MTNYIHIPSLAQDIADIIHDKDMTALEMFTYCGNALDHMFDEVHSHPPTRNDFTYLWNEVNLLLDNNYGRK